MRTVAVVSALALVTAACTINMRGGSGAHAPTTSTPASTTPAPGPTDATPPTPAPVPVAGGTVGARGVMRGIHIAPAASPSGPPMKGTEMVTPQGRLPLVSGDVDFGSNVQYSDSFRGTVFLLPPGATSLPDLSTMKPALALYTRTFEVEPQDFKGLGAPGASLRTNDFAIRYEGFFATKRAGSYHLDLASEDGARVYLDNKVIIDNDGVHVVTYKAADVDLSAGTHLLRVEYFKGSSGKEVNLELWVRTPDMPAGSATMFSPSF